MRQDNKFERILKFNLTWVQGGVPFSSLIATTGTVDVSFKRLLTSSASSNDKNDSDVSSPETFIKILVKLLQLLHIENSRRLIATNF